jgi:hypothetical protein
MRRIDVMSVYNRLYVFWTKEDDGLNYDAE